jgi:hypothetical protein
MFDRPVAAALLRHACGRVVPEERLRGLVDAWCASKRERLSRVADSQRRAMYVELQRRMDGLPAAFVRRAASGIEVCNGVATGGG